MNFGANPIFANEATDKELISKINKQIIQLNDKKRKTNKQKKNTHTHNHKWADLNINRHFSKKT